VCNNAFWTKVNLAIERSQPFRPGETPDLSHRGAAYQGDKAAAGSAGLSFMVRIFPPELKSKNASLPVKSPDFA
jgi:hypothetical protein